MEIIQGTKFPYTQLKMKNSQVSARLESDCKQDLAGCAVLGLSSLTQKLLSLADQNQLIDIQKRHILAWQLGCSSLTGQGNAQVFQVVQPQATPKISEMLPTPMGFNSRKKKL
jgi:hypothetical protein